MNSSRRHPELSVIIPTLNEAAHIGDLLDDVSQGEGLDVIVADGGSKDDTAAQAVARGVRICRGPAGRARQMNQGASLARGAYYLFLHADSRLPVRFDEVVRRVLGDARVAAGAFSLGIDADAKKIRLVEYWANLRSRYLGLPYGDQGLFLRAERFHLCGGFSDLPIMEDFAFIRDLRRLGTIVTVSERIQTSPRRWRRMGVLRTTLINQAIVMGYLLGVSPHRLSRWYRRSRGIDKPGGQVESAD